MDELEYKLALKKVLDEQTTGVLDNLNTTLNSLPEKTQGIELLILPDQDGEGTFSVQVSLTGPDLYVLNKTIEASASLISVIHTSEGLRPPVPYMDPFEASFDVNEVLCTVVALWLTELWAKADTETIHMPVQITSDEDYSTELPIHLRK